MNKELIQKLHEGLPNLKSSELVDLIAAMPQGLMIQKSYIQGDHYKANCPKISCSMSCAGEDLTEVLVDLALLLGRNGYMRQYT